ncbi:exocyst complex component EXO70E2-like [Amaranthus tricolor]|uniref:exocyst complex component EXO70E2-like n=1 Tax=Amaranthus tricolor TaxID=29722 RepID=UPI0025901997|nr:exocyst complex component EXO70E2-like [Amaranthus tricolor]
MMSSIGDVNVGMISSNHHRQENLFAAHSLFKELEANDSLPDYMKKILADLALKLSDMEVTLESNTSESVQVLRNREFNDAKEKLKIAHEKIRVRELNPNMIWELGPELFWDYIHSVEEIVGLLRLFRSLCVEEDVSDVIGQAEDLVQVAMPRFEEGLVHILNKRRRSYVPSEVEENVLEGARFGLNEEGSIVFDLIDRKSVRVLKSIRRIMFDAKYDKEFCGVYVRTQKYALEECLIGLGMETISIDELIKLRSDILASKIKTWTRVVKIAVRVYFSAEKRLCDEIFGESDPIASLCLINITKSFMICFFNFGHAIALGPHTPEKLFYLLDMYEGLAQVREQINTLFGVEEGSLVRTEFEEVMNRLGDSARATFVGFGDQILLDPSTDPFLGGGVHPLSSYVMNYIIVYLPDYCKTLETLLQDKDGNGTSTNSISPEKNLLASHLRSIVANLKSNLEKKSQLYKNTALQHIFLMNNTHYIQQKVIGSELQNIFGDEWIRTQIVDYQQHATSYVRTTWSSVVATFRNDGIPSGSGSRVKLVLKEKIGIFIVAFEEVYRSQTGWIIRDEQLKEELRISISQKVILAYQSFIGRHKKYDIEKYVKYDSDDLENLLRDFFEGSQKSLNYRRR